MGLVLVMLCCLSAYGQQQEITREKYNSAESEAMNKQAKTNRRVIIKAETFLNGMVEKSKETVYERLLPDKTRYLSTEILGGVSKKIESITIGFDQYTRINGGEWKYFDLRGSGSGAMGGGMGYMGKTTYKYTVTADTLDNQTMQLYEEYIEVQEKLGLRYDRERLWITKEGFLLKRENTFGYLSPEKPVSQSVAIYEYNPSDLKIEAPVK